MSSLFETWRRRGRRLDVGGRRLFAVEAGAPDAPCLVVLHGFPTSSLDFHRVLDRLAQSHRVILHDHLGFGFSDKPADAAYSYSLLEQAEAAVELWRQLGVERAHLVAHDYGTSVATEVLARRERGGIPVELSGLTLSNGSVLLELARLRLAQRLTRSPLLGPLFARLVPPFYFQRVMRRLWGDPRRADAADLEAMWCGLRENDGHLRMTAISRYLHERVRLRERWIGALERFDRPLHLLWGRRDPVAVPAIAEALARRVPGAELTWLDDLGHYPMLEDPESWAAAALAFVERQERRAALTHS